MLLGFEKIFVANVCSSAILRRQTTTCPHVRFPLLDCQRTTRNFQSAIFDIQLLVNWKLQIVTRKFLCGANRDRTGNLLVANQALSQLSYSPIASWSSLTPSVGLSGVSRRDAFGRTTDLTLMPSLNVGLSGVEPLTSRLSGVRSNQLSYRPGTA